jgi:hypothetical protein
VRVPGSTAKALQAFWITPATYAGPLIVRGGRIDRPGDLGFGRGRTPSDRLRLPAGVQRPWGSLADSLPAGWRAAQVPIRIEAPGCYSLQLDGRGFSYVVTFAVADG